MPISIAIGQAQSHSGYQAAHEAASQALRAAGKASPALAWVIVAGDYPVEQVLKGAIEALENTPLVGMYTPAGITSDGLLTRGVLVALIAGEGIQAQADWLAGDVVESASAIQRLFERFTTENSPGDLVFIAADGLNVDEGRLFKSLPQGDFLIAGSLVWGDLDHGQTVQIGGKGAGGGGIAVARMAGKFRAGVGVGMGWQPTGARVRVTGAKGAWVRSLDGRPALEAYARFFSVPERDWGFSPLRELVRLYPLGLDVGQAGIQVRSPLLAEADGSLRMNLATPQNSLASILVSSAEYCLAAAKQAAQGALEALGAARPVLALVFPDAAWLTLLEGKSGAEIEAVRTVIGPDVPVAGGYTYGQIYQPKPGAAVELLNQHIQVILLGQAR
jgi:hypothetical protein